MWTWSGGGCGQVWGWRCGRGDETVLRPPEGPEHPPKLAHAEDADVLEVELVAYAGASDFLARFLAGALVSLPSFSFA
eukprot:629435-Pyramimonas_sp.AAC.1